MLVVTPDDASFADTIITRLTEKGFLVPIYSVVGDYLCQSDDRRLNRLEVNLAPEGMALLGLTLFLSTVAALALATLLATCAEDAKIAQIVLFAGLTIFIAGRLFTTDWVLTARFRFRFRRG